MSSFSTVLINLLSDLTLSGIAYFTLAVALNQTMGHIKEFLPPSWTLLQPAYDDIQYESMILTTAFINWSMRFLFRCRGHFACAAKSLASILRWLSPLHPEPLKFCLSCCCWMRTHEGEAATGMESRRPHHQCEVRRACSIERMSCPASPAPTLHGEERCLTFDSFSYSRPISPVSADEITNEWRDVGHFSDKERMKESLGPAVSPVADESTSGWRDLACYSDRERTEDTAGQTD